MANATKNFLHLKAFFLTNVHSTSLGERSPCTPVDFGDLKDLFMGGRICSGRKLNVRFHCDEQYVTDTLLHACTLLSKLRHQNIARFLGLSYYDGPCFPLVVSEYTPYNLAHLLEEITNISLLVKRSILCDVATGLDYLHRQQPAVVHRGLTARSILLSSAMTAKLGDIGITELENLPTGCQLSMVSQL